ncbi:MAG: hypothetical protein OXR07_06825, partial [Nitrospira sp.]|nr:hypothetical protein [Nitrospira sp.]
MPVGHNDDVLVLAWTGLMNPGRSLGWVAAGLGRGGSSFLRKQESRLVFGVGSGPWEGGIVMPAEAGIQA